MANQQPPNMTFIKESPSVGPHSSRVQCPHCQATVMTNVEYEPNTRTHLLAIILCLCLCWCCACVPYFTNSCQSGNHYCPNCKGFVGTYQT